MACFTNLPIKERLENYRKQTLRLLLIRRSKGHARSKLGQYQVMSGQKVIWQHDYFLVLLKKGGSMTVV